MRCPVLPGQPAQLTHDDVVTLFHEFGHGLHHMLTRVRYPSIAGINGVAWDAVELPSQFMENYAWQPEVLRELTAASRDGRAAARRRRSRSCCARAVSRRASPRCARSSSRCSISACTREYDPAAGARVREILAEVRREVAVIAVPEWNRYPNSFGHIFAGGYAAGYYSYKWAEVLAADAFAAFEEAGVFDRATAQRFVDSILSRGGSRTHSTAFVEFRGSKPDIEPLLRSHGIAA